MKKPERKMPFTFHIDPKQYNAIKQYSAHTDIGMATLVRKMIDKFMDEKKQELERMGVDV